MSSLSLLVVSVYTHFVVLFYIARFCISLTFHFFFVFVCLLNFVRFFFVAQTISQTIGQSPFKRSKTGDSKRFKDQSRPYTPMYSSLLTKDEIKMNK